MGHLPTWKLVNRTLAETGRGPHSLVVPVLGTPAEGRGKERNCMTPHGAVSGGQREMTQTSEASTQITGRAVVQTYQDAVLAVWAPRAPRTRCGLVRTALSLGCLPACLKYAAFP